MTNNVIAERTLNTKHRETGASGKLLIEVHRPYALTQDMVNFPIENGAAGCSLRFVGLGTDLYDDEVVGIDTLQAIQLASDVEGILKKISQNYELFFTDGSPYFE